MLVVGLLGDVRTAEAKPGALTPAEQANSGVVTYEQRTKEFPACQDWEDHGVETVHFKLVFSGVRSLEVTSLDVANDEGNIYKRTKKNVWGKTYGDGGRVVIKFRPDGMTLQSWVPDGGSCVKYSRVIMSRQAA